MKPIFRLGVCVVLVFISIFGFLSGFMLERKLSAQEPIKSWVIYAEHGTAIIKIQDGSCSLYVAQYNAMIAITAGQGCK